MENGFANTKEYLSQRGSILFTEDCFLDKYMFKCFEFPWTPQNPRGIVNLGTAENSLCEDILVKKLNEPGLYTFKPEFLHYFDYHGLKSCRLALAKFASRFFNASVSLGSENIILVCGTSSALDIIAHLVADPGESFMCPAPFYTRIRADMYEKSLVDIININLSSNDKEPFELSLENLKRTYEKAIDNGKKIKGIVLINPNNPLGCIYSKEQLMPIFQFASSKKIYVVLDELYALSVFDEEAKFPSVLSFWDQLPDPSRVIWLWGLSKDFGSAGMRVSMIHTENQVFLNCAKKLTIFQCLPAFVHSMLENFLSDYDWIEKIYLPQNRAKMRANFATVKEWLENMKIEFCAPKGAFFVYVNFSKYMENQTNLDEKRLFDVLFNAGVYVVPGSNLYAAEPGWFRMVFTVKQENLVEGLKRLESALLQLK